MTTLPVPAEIAALPVAGDPNPVPAVSVQKARACAWCGVEFLIRPGPGQHKRFCTPEHRIAFANREKAQGAVLVTIAKAWRRKRGAGPLGKSAFHEMTSILDQLLDADRRDGRLAPDAYISALLSDQYMDRKRPTRRAAWAGSARLEPSLPA